MLGKVQEITAKLDKKRAYTAVGAMVVALATGHVMQRNVGEPNPGVDQPSQQAAVAPAPAIPADNSPKEDEIAALRDIEETSNPVEPAPDAAWQASNADTVDVTRPETDPAPEAPLRVSAMANDVTPIDISSASLASFPLPGRSPESVTDDAPDVAASEPASKYTADPGPGPETDETTLAEVTRASTRTDFAPRDAIVDVAPAGGKPIPGDTASCTTDLRVSPAKGAMLDLLMMSPCNAGAEVDFDHAGLKFTETLDDTGQLRLQVPAMTTEAVVEAELEGSRFTARAVVGDMADYDRVALVWQGGTGLQLHALENGAFYGETGHVWAETPGTQARAEAGEGGFVTVLGSTGGGFAADIYTYPASMGVAPAISIEAQVLEATCDGAIVGTYLRSTPEAAPKTTEVGMVLPGCDALGEYLVLKNLPQDLTIARN